MYVYCNAKIMNTKADTMFVLSSLLTVLTVHMYNFESISVAEEIIHLQNHANCLHV